MIIFPAVIPLSPHTSDIESRGSVSSDQDSIDLQDDENSGGDSPTNGMSLELTLSSQSLLEEVEEAPDSPTQLKPPARYDHM